MSDIVIKVENISKEYRLGAIGGGTLYGDLNSWWAKVRGKENPNSTIGSKDLYFKNERFLALDDVSFNVKQGDTLGIIGRNGAGKSTLLKLLSRVTAPTKGEIKIRGRIASMLEVGTGFHPELTGRENVYLNGAILGMTKAEVTKKFDEIVAFAEMEQFIDTPVKRYSSGMYVKLAFAVAAHLDSEILVMDEVLAVGDMKFQEKCLGKMGDVADREGRTVIYVSHNMNTIRQLCNRCVVLDKGKVKYDGDTEESIGTYLENAADLVSFVNYEKIERGTYGSLVEMKCLEILGKKENVFSSEEGIIKGIITCFGKLKVENIRIRAEISFIDNTMIGTSLSTDVFEIENGEIVNIAFNLDIKNFPVGKYQVKLLLYQSNSYGSEKPLDRISPGFCFEIREDFDEENIVWLHQHWGHIRLENIRLRKL